MRFSLARRTFAEFLGTGFLVTTVVGSGIMGERLSSGNAALALLANSIATGAVLSTLIFAFGEISGAHFNPVVTIVGFFSCGTAGRDVVPYCGAQIVGGLAGTLTANLMFGLPALEISHHPRSGQAQFFSEVIATFGLMVVVAACSRLKPNFVAIAVGGYIAAAYWFTSSTSFANPAVTFARCMTDTFAGIRPQDVPGFVAAQFAGGALALAIIRWMFSTRSVELSGESGVFR